MRGLRIRAYCQAVESRHRDALESDRGATEWLSFARDYADRLQRPSHVPADPEVTHESLEPFMGGWSPYGPHNGRF